MKFDRLIIKAQELLPYIDSRSRCKHISFLLEGNKIISAGFNQGFKTHPIGKLNQHRFDNTHAELAAIIKTRWRIDKLGKLTLVNLRFLKDGNLSMSKPCIPCQKMLFSFGITDIWYSNTAGEMEKMK
jgi:deoxycytidylate deaminase